MDINKLSSKIIKTAINVHEELGPGLLESDPQNLQAKKSIIFFQGEVFFLLTRPLMGDFFLTLFPCPVFGKYYSKTNWGIAERI